jgi:hypothetical protein
MKKNNKNHVAQRVKNLALLICVLTIISVQAQFTSRGWASFVNIGPNSLLEPIELLPDNITLTSGYGVGNVNPDKGDGENYIVIIKGDLNVGAYWQEEYRTEGSMKAVKAVMYKERAYILFNVIDNANNAMPLYSGIFCVDPSNGSVIQTINIAKVDGLAHEAKDFTFCNENFIVVGEKTDMYSGDKTGAVTVIDANSLNTLTGFKPFFQGLECVLPEKVVSYKDQFYVLFQAKTQCNDFYNNAVVASFYYDNAGNYFNLLTNKSYQTPSRLAFVNLAFNSYNYSLVLLFQEWGGIDGAGTLNLFILDPGTLLPTSTNSYFRPGRFFHSNICVDYKRIVISGANNVFDMAVYGSSKVLFNYSGAFLGMINNPYSTNLLGFEKQRVYKKGVPSLFVTQNLGMVNWVYGYGPSKNCGLAPDALYPFKNDVKILEEFKYENLRVSREEAKIESRPIEFIANIECGSFKGKASSGTTDIFSLDQEDDIRILRFENKITLQADVILGNYKVIDSFGKVIKQGKSDKTTIDIETETLSKGLYFINFEKEGVVITRKLIF